MITLYYKKLVDTGGSQPIGEGLTITFGRGTSSVNPFLKKYYPISVRNRKDRVSHVNIGLNVIN